MPSHLHADFGGELAHQRQHALPLGEHDDLALRLRQEVAQDALQLLELGADAAARIEDRGRVADHAHAGEQLHEAVELRRQQRALLRLGKQSGGRLLVVRVAQALLVDHRHEIVLHGAAGQLRLDVGLAAAEHHRLQAPPQLGEHALDVLAGAQAVDAVIDAAAGISEAIEAADLHLVEAPPASGLRPEGSEERMLRLERLDGDDLGRAPPAAQRELVLVAGPPSLWRRPVENGAGLAGRTRLAGRFGAGRFLLASRISTSSHRGTVGGGPTASIDRRSLSALSPTKPSAAASGHEIVAVPTK